jgi:hypothetical protein
MRRRPFRDGQSDHWQGHTLQNLPNMPFHAGKFSALYAVDVAKYLLPAVRHGIFTYRASDPYNVDPNYCSLYDWIVRSESAGVDLLLNGVNL